MELALHPAETDRLAFDVIGRNRPLPLDPSKALLSFGSSMLTRDVVVTLLAVGFGWSSER